MGFCSNLFFGNRYTRFRIGIGPYFLYDTFSIKYNIFMKLFFKTEQFMLLKIIMKRAVSYNNL